jgi:hypothetical protein
VSATRRALEEAQHLHIRPIVALEGVDASHMPKLSDVRVEYYLYNDERPVVATPAPGFAPDHFQILLEDMTPGTLIRAITLIDQASGRRWALQNIAPLQPEYLLKRATP